VCVFSACTPKRHAEEKEEMITPAFMDIFGVIGFSVLLRIGISLWNEAKKRAIILVGISSIGLIVDLYIVVTTFLI